MDELFEAIRTHQERQWYKNKTLGVIPEVYAKPTGVQLEITYRCNLRCEHCYNESGEPSKLKFPGEMSNEAWICIAQELVELEIFAVIISGGEPFLRTPLVLKLAEVFHRADIRMGIISNGWFLNERVVSRLVPFQKSINWVQVSIDGADPQVHDRIRGVKGSFDRAVRAIVTLRKHGFYVKMATAIMPGNMHQLEDFFELALFIGTNTLHIGNVFDIGTASNIDVDSESRKAVIDKLVKYKDFYSHCMDIMISMDPCMAVQLFCKHRLNNVFIIRPNGELKLDCAVPVIFGKYKCPGDLGKLWRESGLDTAYENPVVQDVIARITREQSFANVRDIGLDSSKRL